MSTTRRLRSVQPMSSYIVRAGAVMLAVVAPFAAAQAVTQTTLTGAPNVQPVAVEARLDLPNLPDAPDALVSSSNDGAAQGTSADPATPNAVRFKKSAHFSLTVAPNELATPMSSHDKVIGGLKDSVSLFSAAGWFGAAGWEQLTNGSPNYGTDRGAFGARLGAAAARGVSENIFSNSLFAPILHEDPRYYIMGRGNNFFKRIVYAGTRVIITKTDGGHTTPNFSLLAGNAAGSALTILYYPQKNTTFSEVAQTFGGSLGGSAIGFVATEFIADALEYVHLKKRQ